MEFSMITDRSEVTNTIRAAKVQKNISWAEVARAIGPSREWTTAGCLGQMTFNKEQAEAGNSRQGTGPSTLTARDKDAELDAGVTNV
jgi:cyanate lyase